MGTLVPMVQGQLFQDTTGFYPPPQFIFVNQNINSDFGTPSFVLQPTNPQLFQSPELIQFVQQTPDLPQLQQPGVAFLQTAHNPEVVQLSTLGLVSISNSTQTLES
jgi:hypothetical protein